MSTSEIESGKAGLQSGKRINGWWRLWIVVSLIWLIFAISYAISGWFDEGLNKETAKHHQIYQKLDYTNKSIVFEIDECLILFEIVRLLASTFILFSLLFCLRFSDVVRV